MSLYYQSEVSILGPVGYGPTTLPLRHSDPDINNGELYLFKDANLTQRLSKLHARTYLNACYGTPFMVFGVTCVTLSHTLF